MVVVAIFAGVLLAKVLGASPSDASVSGDVAAGVQNAQPTITSVHNDAAADYAAAMKTGKPVYVLFHSLTCQPCVEDLIGRRQGHP